MSNLIIVSNRLPISIATEDGKSIFRQSSGGLISAVSAFLSKNDDLSYTSTIWAGVAGCTKEEWQTTTKESGAMDVTYLPLFMSRKQYELYYNGFSNSMLWPLFHYFPTYADYSSYYYEAYMETNLLFAEKLFEVIAPGDTVWIHDYHLLPLAAMLRKKIPSLTIGFFLHIPFPSYEMFRLLPKVWQRELLEGMLGADLIGFHTDEYVGHFLNCVEATIKPEFEDNHILWNHRQIKVAAFPISIDYNQFNDAYEDPDVKSIREGYQGIKKDRKLIFSVDRLDYTKGISNRLSGFNQFLRENPEAHDKVVFALTIVPSRDSIKKYADRKKMIDEYIGRLNARYGNLTWQPILYQYTHLSFSELVALYTLCDVALITPLRDGMNLVSKEFVASRKDKKGVLILSEMAGASLELSEALLINPNDNAEIAAMIKYGLGMNDTEQAERMETMQQHLIENDVVKWATQYFASLSEVKHRQIDFKIKFLDSFSRINLIKEYCSSQRRLFLLDYDGSLIPFSKHPSLAKPTNELLEVLKQLSATPLNDVFIVSGRDSNTLEAWFANIPIGLVAEHGARVRYRNQDWVAQAGTGDDQWMASVEKIMNRYVLKCPHSFVERKEYSLAWHYRNAESMQGTMRAKGLRNELAQAVATMPLNILNGNKVIEVRNAAVNKGAATAKLLNNRDYDFIFAIGDDVTDEDMFRELALNEHAWTIKVGNDASFAKYNLHNPQMVLSLLQAIAVHQLQAAG